MSWVKDFEVLCSVGSGAFGKCEKIRRNSDGKILAWKVVSTLKMTKHLKRKLIQEVNLLRELDHPNIVQYFDHFIDQENKKVYIVMEYCKGGDLASVIKGCIKERSFLDEEFVLRVLVQLASALKHCHRRPDGSVVLHQDLKPANVFLDPNGSVKLGDFGLAQILPSRNDCTNIQAGTIFYKCPEKLNQTFYNEKSDIWSLGCLIYELCALKPPFTACLRKSVNRGEFKRIPSHYSDKLNSLIRDMLQVLDFLRPSAQDILHSSLLTDMVAEQKQRSGDPDHPLPQIMSVPDLSPKEQQDVTTKVQKRKLDAEHHQPSKQRREGLCGTSWCEPLTSLS